MKKYLLIGLMVMAVTVACDDDEGAASGSCTVTANDLTYCFSYDDASLADDLETACDATTGGSYDSGACDIDDAIGKCNWESSDGIAAVTEYGEGYDADSAESACDLINGTWEPN